MVVSCVYPTSEWVKLPFLYILQTGDKIKSLELLWRLPKPPINALIGCDLMTEKAIAYDLHNFHTPLKPFSEHLCPMAVELFHCRKIKSSRAAQQKSFHPVLKRWWVRSLTVPHGSVASRELNLLESKICHALWFWGIAYPLLCQAKWQ